MLIKGKFRHSADQNKQTSDIWENIHKCIILQLTKAMRDSYTNPPSLLSSYIVIYDRLLSIVVLLQENEKLMIIGQYLDW